MTDNYPFKAPKCTFTTKMYHPNINLKNGELCDDIYKSDWKPVSNMKKVCTVIMSMLHTPNLDAPI